MGIKIKVYLHHAKLGTIIRFIRHNIYLAIIMPKEMTINNIKKLLLFYSGEGEILNNKRVRFCGLFTFLF